MDKINLNNNKYKIRKSFKKYKNVIEIPNLLSIQLKAFHNFINNNNSLYSIHSVLNSFFPIIDSNKNITLEYINYKLENPIFSSEECKINGITYSSSLNVNLKLIKNNKKKIQQVYICEIPIITKNGSFIINGTERAVVPQLHRSPGVFFGINNEKNNKLLYAKIIPHKGSWLNIEIDNKNIIYIKIDKKKKFFITTFLYSIGINNNEIILFFFKKIDIWFYKEYIILEYSLKEINIDVINYDIYNNSLKYKIKNIKIIKDKFSYKISVNYNYLIDKILYEDFNIENKVLYAGTKLDDNIIKDILKNNINKISIILENKKNYLYILNTINNNKNYEILRNESSIYIYKNIKSNDLPDLKIINTFIYNLFFSDKKYDLSIAGRMKINCLLKHDNLNINTKYLSKYDILYIIKKLIDIKNKDFEICDLDSLDNRRVKLIDEIMDNQFRIGIYRLEKSIKEKISSIDMNKINPQDLINTKFISSIIKEFFTSSQLSQFMDQNNPLSEITHKRRVSSLGPGGLVKERAGFEIRDIHYSHYGKLCPIETPEGPNIGLINSLSVYTRVNKYGFLETPYVKVINANITREIVYLSSIEDYNYIITQSDITIDKENNIIDLFLMCRYKGNISLFHKKNIDFIDVSVIQMISIGVSLIPFLEHNDANRALMGTNMQRQAVPVINSESPLIGTGTEYNIALDSKHIIVANRGGRVSFISNDFIIINVNYNEYDINNENDNGLDIYYLNKFSRSNQNILINNKILVSLNEIIEKNDIIADNYATSMGELALGKNLRVAFMSWRGYNFEDSIVISKRIVDEDILTSIHIQEFLCVERETKLGPEEITINIPNVNKTDKLMLDENGIIKIGTYVEEGDILVGKITPKIESQPTPEEKLLKAIFGDKNNDVKDSSLRVPHGISGLITNIRIFTNKKKNNKIIYNNIIKKYNIIKQILFDNISDIYKNNAINNDIKIEEIINYDINDNIVLNIAFNNINNKELFFKIFYAYKNIHLELNKDIENENIKNKNITELPLGVIRIVKVYISTVRKIQVGDKIAGRHGNKGVISKIVPIEDMPYDEDGNIIDIILNPLGVPSRMNIGQILETNLGMAAKKIGEKINMLLKGKLIFKLREYLNNIYKIGENIIQKINFDKFDDKYIIQFAENMKDGLFISTSPFDGANINEIKDIMKFAEINESGKMFLFDGISGTKFDRKVTVGYMYIMKLNHLVDDKIHARSTGPYSLITQQPLGGKSQFGGQRFGEMEVWALEAYGASYTLQEMLTVKSDDIYGRTMMYKNIVNEKYDIKYTIPESFNVLLKEMKSLCLNIDLKQY